MSDWLSLKSVRAGTLVFTAVPPVPGSWQHMFVGIRNVVLDQKGVRFWLLGGREHVPAL